MNANGPLTRSDRVATLDEAKAQFQRSWDAKAWARLEDVVAVAIKPIYGDGWDVGRIYQTHGSLISSSTSPATAQ